MMHEPAPDRRTGHRVDRSRSGRVPTDGDRRTGGPVGTGPFLARRVRRHPGCRQPATRPSCPVAGGARRGRRTRSPRVVRSAPTMPELHDALAVRDGRGWSCGCGGAGRWAGRASRCVPSWSSRPPSWWRRRRCRRSTGSNATSATSPGACPPMTGWRGGNGSAGSGSCIVGPTTRPGCATPTSPSTPKPTPASPPCWTPRSPPNGPSPTPKPARSTSCVPTPSSPPSPDRAPGSAARPR